MRIRSSQLVLSLCGCLSGILTDDAQRQQDALEFLGVTDLITASPEWLDFCYNYPMFLFVASSGSYALDRREKLSTSAEYMIQIFKNKLGMYLLEGSNHALDCCFTWHDETIINDPSDWYWMVRCGDEDHVPENLYGILQKMSILIATGYGESAAFDNGLHEEYPEWYLEYVDEQTEGLSKKWFQMIEFAEIMKTGTTTNSILHNGPISIGIECTDLIAIYEKFPIEPDPDIDTDIDCHFNLRLDYNYTPIAEKYKVPIVIDSPSVVASSKWYKFINVTNNETFWSENSLPDETVAYVYAYYICEHIYDLFFHPFTSSTEEPTTTTEEPTTTTVELNTTTEEPDTTTAEKTTTTTEATTPTTEATTPTTEPTTPTTEPTTPTTEPTTPTTEPTTSTTEPTTKPTTDGGVVPVVPTEKDTTSTTTSGAVIPTDDTTDGGVVPVVPTEKDTTSTTSTSGALIPTDDTKLIPKTGSDSSNMGIVISATVGSVAFLGAVGILAFLLKGQWRREEVELEEPEVFGSGNYEVKEEEE